MTDSGSIRVLHVDEDANVLDLVETYLENENDSLSIVGEDSPQAGLDRLDQRRIDCVVSDHRTPEFDGLEFYDRVSEQYPEMPFILYTGHGSEEIASEAVSAGVTDYVQKQTGTEQYAVLANTIVNAVERVRAEEALRESEERLDEFASLVAHDLRNPLNVLSGRVELARETGDDVHFDAMVRSIDTMETLLEDMRDLARLGMPIHEAGVVDIAEVADLAWGNLADAAGTLTLTADLPTVEADGDRLERLFVECFENATVHADDHVSVRVEPTEDGFAIVDDGPGIDETERERVLDGGYTTETDRTGFGLAIVDWIADAHGWSVAVEESTDGGARIVVSGIS